MITDEDPHAGVVLLLGCRFLPHATREREKQESELDPYLSDPHLKNKKKKEGKGWHQKDGVGEVGDPLVEVLEKAAERTVCFNLNHVLAILCANFVVC